MLEIAKHVDPYEFVDYWSDDTGYCVWRLGTGLNVELLHLKTIEKRKGHGRNLIKNMLQALDCDINPPRNSVFGFCLASNKDAILFYMAMGFDVTPVPHIYIGQDAVCFSQNFAVLMERHFS